MPDHICSIFVCLFCRLILKITSYFQEHEIAHNMFMTRGTVFGDGPSSENRTVRIYLWPRKKFVGQKMFEEFNVACIEFGGHLPVKGNWLLWLTSGYNKLPSCS